MKERPILFSGPMVRAILDGKKSQTRRLAKLPPGCEHDGVNIDRDVVFCSRPDYPTAERLVMCPYGAVGDRLWVRERWSPRSLPSGGEDSIRDAGFSLTVDGAHKFRDGGYYPGLPEYAPDAFEGVRWRPSIHMPRWASRITLEVVGVRVERLKSITDGDAIAEGVDPYECPSGPARPCARSAFAELWDRINGQKAPWASNPWVWKISFRRVEK